jgi:hypothetical protein
MATATKKKRKKRVNCKLLRLGKRVKGTSGWTIVNGTGRQMFVITQDHIDDGVPGDSTECPVALALRAAFGDQYEYEVGAAITKIIDEVNKVFVRFATPVELGAQIKTWDRPRGTKFGTWKLKPGPQFLNPLPKSWLAMYTGHAKTSKTNERAASKLVITRNGHVKRVKIVKKTVKRRASPTRIVRRVAPISV